MSNSGHGSVGTREQQFTELLPLRKKIYHPKLLLKLSEEMKSLKDDVHDGADAEENLWVPAVYTYFGQFVDHDLTFDNTSSLNSADMGEKSRLPTNLRTPRFDLDSLYGDGPDAQPFLYDDAGESLLFKNGEENSNGTKAPFTDQAQVDLLRSPNGRAIIGDKRNDENVIVGQIQLLVVRYHNAVVKKLKAEGTALSGTALFEKARNEVRWTYQTLVIEDFLPRIVQAEVLKNLHEAISVEERAPLYALYTPDKRGNLPREFVVAAYRYGHSGVRQGYRLNGVPSTPFPFGTILNIFPGSGPIDAADPADPADPTKEITLLGFKPLPATHVIDDFGRFFPTTKPASFDDPAHPRVPGDGKQTSEPPSLQFAYKLDTNIIDPLGALPVNVMPTSSTKGGAFEEVSQAIAPCVPPDTAPPPRLSLALLNLLRGNIYRVQGGQEIARVLRNKGLHEAKTLTAKQLVVRTGRKDEVQGINFYKFEPIDPELQKDTPLWFYILAEAQAPIADYFQDPVKFPTGEFPETELLNGIGAVTQLGWVGGRIIAEVFYGLLDADEESFVNAAPTGWKPMLGGTQEPIFLNLVKFVDEQEELLIP